MKISARVVFASLLCFLYSLGTVSIHAAPYLDSTRIAMLNEAQGHLFNDQFAEADSIYVAYHETYPDDPCALLFRAVGLMAHMSDAEEELHSDLFHTLLNQSDSLAVSILDTCDDRAAAWMYLLRGHARAQRSLWESRFGSFLSAVKMGLSADNEYTAALKRDSTLYDIYAGLGSYHYWKSAKAGVLRWLGFFKNEKDKGIEELELAADSSIIHRELSASALIWIWLDRKEYDTAIAISRTFVERYPEGKTFLWPIAQAFYAQTQYDSAAAVYQRIRERLAAEPGNYYNMIECDYYIVHCLTWEGRDAAASEAARRMPSYLDNIPEETQHRQRSKIRYLKRVAER